MAETKFINFRYGTYDEIHGLGKDANCIYIANDKPLLYAVGKWHGIASMTSEVDRVNNKTILKINGDGGYVINCEIEGETLSKDLKEKLINAYDFVQLISGEDEDVIINKWNEIVAFLQGFGEADKLLNVVVELQNDLADEVANRINADLKHTEDIKSITDLVNDMFTLVDKGDGTKFIKSKYGFASDSFISARGVDNESSGVGGLDAQAVWDLLMQNDDVTKIINVAHIPDITVAKITDFTAKVGDLIANKADKATTLSGYGITDAVTLNTAQTISGAKTFSFGYGSTFSLKSEDSNLTIDVNTTGGWNRGLKWANSSVENYGYSLLGTYGSGIDILYMYMGFDGEDITSNPSFRFYKGGKLTHKTLDVQESAHANVIANLNAEMVGGKPLDKLFAERGSIPLNDDKAYDYNKALIAGGYNTVSFADVDNIVNAPFSNYGTLLYVTGKGDTWMQLASEFNRTSLYVRSGNIRNSEVYTVTNWKKVAFTDSNVASATKLETPRLIWGQSFDGTNNVSGTLYLGANSILGGDNLNILSHSASGYLEIGYGNATAGYSTYINGNSIHFRYSTEHNTGILLSSNGNVGIGTVAPTAKLHVNGDSIINGKLTVANQLTIGNATLYWDVANQCLRVNAGIASDSFLSARGIDTTGNGQGGGGGFDATMLWNELTIPSPTNSGKTIMLDLLPDMPTSKISDFNTAVATAMASTLADISSNLSNHEQRLQAIERALTWQGVS